MSAYELNFKFKTDPESMMSIRKHISDTVNPRMLRQA
jgi:hypothetical protein